MYLVEWFLTGAIVGWTIPAATRNWLIVLEYLRSFNIPVRPFSKPVAAILDFVFFLIALSFLIWLAVYTDNALLPNAMISVKSIFLGVRFQALALGFFVSIFAFRQRLRLESILRRLGNAIVGDEENTAWALQSAVAILVVLIVVFAFRPDFFEYLRSLKVGGLEATFADRSSITVREASLHLTDLKEQLTLEEYKGFRQKFLDPNSARGQARELFSQTKIEEKTGEITARFFDLYVDPIIVSLTCLNKKRALATAVHDYDLVAYSAAWENFLLTLHADTTTFSQEVIRSFLEQLRSLSLAVAKRANKIAPECMSKEAENALKIALENEQATPEAKALVEIQASVEMDIDANAIARRYRDAANILKEQGRDKPEIFALTILEPYLTGAAADLIALISGHREKAEFLTKMLDKFPHSDELVTPGIVNVFYQVTDARLNSPSSWPLELTLSDLDYAIQGADLMMSRSADLLARHSKVPEPAGEIFDIFIRNVLIALTTKLQVFNQRVLANESLPEHLRQSWIQALSRLLAMMKTRSITPLVSSDTLPSTTLDQTTTLRLPLAKVEQDYILEADLAISLSIILIEGARPKATAIACNTALYYVNDAKHRLKNVVDDNSLDRAAETRWRQLVAVIAQRTADSCDWKDRRD
jgi:hypothetical protein